MRTTSTIEITPTIAYLLQRFQDTEFSWRNRLEISQELVEAHGFESTESANRITIEACGYVIASATR